jgi:nitrate/nitrite transporter NarK
MEKVKVYGYRWVVLAAFMLINCIMQMHWLNFAPITTDAEQFYNVSELQIGLFSMSFMIMFIFMCIPASYVIDTYGIRIGVGVGAVLTAVFGMIKGIYADSYNAILISSFGLAVGQPFILNAVTKVGAEWFPIEERATAAGLGALSQYLGFVVAMALTPVLFKLQGMKGMLMSYGYASLAIAVLFFIFIKDKPPTPPTHRHEVRHSVFIGLKHMFKIKDMILILILFFIGLGMFNAVSTWIEPLLKPRGINPEQAGLIGAAMIVGGIIGAVVIPVLSDKQRKRKAYLILCMIGIVPGLVGMTFLSGFVPLLIAGFVLGFFTMSAGPVGFQYGAEVSFPTPESTSQGMILLAGQISGILFIYLMNLLKNPETGSMTNSMIIFLVLMIGSAVAALLMKESPMIMTQTELIEKTEEVLERIDEKTAG